MKRNLIAALFAVAALVGGAGSAQSGNIIDDWASVQAPPAPALKPVTVDAKTDALFVFDMVKPLCNAQRSPRCFASIPAIKQLLAAARAKGVLVIYSSLPNVPKTEIDSELAPTGNEPFVQSYLNKFLGTDLEKILKEKGIQTVIAVGWIANGAVLTTASELASRGFKVVVPVDGVSGITTYAEQYTAWHLSNTPVISTKITLTTSDMIKF
jgi:nicotinamidase-related amidase